MMNTLSEWEGLSDKLKIFDSKWNYWDGQFFLTRYDKCTDPFDMILKVWYRKPSDETKYLKLSTNQTILLNLYMDNLTNNVIKKL